MNQTDKTIVQIKSRFDGSVLYEGAAGMTLLGALVSAARSGANLAGAYLADANLAGANLADAHLPSAYLAGAYLDGAHLTSANLAGANLAGAYLARANLTSANLAGANLTSANLTSADLTGAYLADAHLTSADLTSANLAGANLAGAYLARANLTGAKNAEVAIARTRILPEGSIIGWKRCGAVIVKLLIPAEAKRSHAFGRKCRAEYADVLEVIGGEVGVSDYDHKTEYRVGQRVNPDRFDENWQEECAAGIHFFITEIEARVWEH